VSEEILNDLPIDDLIDLMAKSSDELLEMDKFSSDRFSVEQKKREVELLQKVIVAKRTEFSPRQI
jgi:hypothetical protein